MSDSPRDFIPSIPRNGINALRSSKHNNLPFVMKCFDLHRTLKNTKIKYCWNSEMNEDKVAENSNATWETFDPLIDALQAVKCSHHRIWKGIWDRQTL
ncbi:hypothetical protein AVEN_257461-1 [Araneus ventricosus]|uniref:Uncharacterized protein n=1 Tax=Araneus ventricosus TaxID=182803 RepID=A0A4Y2L5V8_ARAVE|nr:hypothetical protein AVEN_257461-1 [Araneus ventricosus]